MREDTAPEMHKERTHDAVIESVTLRVHDLDQSNAFYRDVLGLEPRANDAGEMSSAAPGRMSQRMSFAAPGNDAPMVHLIEDPRARPRPPRTLGLYHFALLVPDRPALGAVLQRLAERRVRLQGASDHDVSEALYLADPDGHGLEIYRDRPPETWTYTAAGELFMTTKPLDAGDLASSAAGPRGLPTGTTIGHIHLHVSSIEKAEAFYADDLGFDVTVRSYPGALFLSTGGYHHHVGLNTWAGPHAERPDDQTIGMASVALHPPKRPAPAGETIVDPDGIRIQLSG